MFRSLTALALLGLASTALAGDKKDREEALVRYKAVTEIDFRELEIEAPLVRPPFKYVSQLTGLEFESMIRPRVEWRAEMKASVDEVR